MSVVRPLLLLALALCQATPASAQNWPDRPVRLVAPYPPGGQTDLVSRFLAERLAPVLGQLIWGDAQFTERLNALNPAESDQLSSKSHLCRMLARDVTKWINITALSDAPGTGVHGTFYSAVVANIDNWRRFTTTGPDGANALPDLYADPRIGGKCVLHILDPLAVTYAGGPAANPHFATVHSTLYASRDPVALDALGARLLDGWRSAANLPVLGAKVAWLQGAASIGNFEESMIRLVAGK